MESYIRQKATITPNIAPHLLREQYSAKIANRSEMLLILPNIATRRAMFNASYIGCDNASKGTGEYGHLGHK